MAFLLNRLGGVDPIVQLAKSSAARKSAADLRLLFYTDRQSEDLLAQLKQRWSNPEEFRLFSVNIVRKIINKRSMVYKTAPYRTFEGMDQAKGEALYAAMGANIVLKKANRLTKLLKTTVLKVGWNENRLALSVVTPNVLDVEHDGDPEFPTRYIITHPGSANGNPYKEADTTYSVWTANSYTRHDYKGHSMALSGNPNGVNPYGMLPFVPCFDYAPDDIFFLPGGDDLVEAQRAVNVALVNLWRAIEMQSHGQAWATGLPSGDALRVGPDRTVSLPADGKFGFAAPNTPIEEVLRAIEFVIKQTAAANDLSPAIFELDPKAESGAAKNAENRDLLEARQDDIDLWRVNEARLFEVVKRVVNTHAPGSIPEGATVRVDFGEITESIGETDRLDAYQRRMDMGVWSPVDVLMADNPDIRTREDAMKELHSRRQESAVLGVGFADPSFNEVL